MTDTLEFASAAAATVTGMVVTAVGVGHYCESPRRGVLRRRAGAVDTAVSAAGCRESPADAGSDQGSFGEPDTACQKRY